MTIPSFDPSKEECECACHRTLGIVHVAPCCTPCPKCLRRVANHALAEHLKRCSSGARPLSRGAS